MYSLLNFHKLITSMQPAPRLRMTVLTVCVSECVSEGVCVIFCHVRLFVTLWTVAQQASLSMGFHRQE